MISKSFTEYAVRLAKLHRLIRTGRDEGSEGDALRDEMDYWWYQLTPDEVEQAGRLSEDLYFVHESESEVIPFKEQLWREIELGLEQGNWWTAIETIRKYRNEIPAHIAAFLFGICWKELGDWALAHAFFASSYDHQRDAEALALCTLSAALRSGISQEDVDIATHLATSSSNPAVILKAAEVIEWTALTSQEPLARELNLSRQAAARGIALIDTQQMSEDERNMVVHAYLGIALTSAVLGETAEAQEACNRALSLDPGNLEAFMVAGFVNSGDPNNREASSRLSNRLRETSSIVLPAPSVLSSLQSFALN